MLVEKGGNKKECWRLNLNCISIINSIQTAIFHHVRLIMHWLCFHVKYAWEEIWCEKWWKFIHIFYFVFFSIFFSNNFPLHFYLWGLFHSLLCSNLPPFFDIYSYRSFTKSSWTVFSLYIISSLSSRNNQTGMENGKIKRKSKIVDCGKINIYIF